jgi:RNA polymerase subunit RPABC4/transcription elongation factor Spt4
LNLSENLSNSFEFAKKLLSDGGRLIILIVLDIIPIVNWIVIGYAARVLRESPSTGIPPKLEKYGEMFVDGAKVAFASLIYMLVPAILIAAGASSLFAGILSMQIGVVSPSVMLGGTGVVLLLVGIALGIVLLFLLAAGMAHMLKTGKFGKAFAFGEMLTIIKRIGWGKYVAWIVVLLLISAIVGGAAGLIPYVGWVISAIISPILSVFIFRSLGLLYNEGAPPELQVQSSATGAEIRLVCSSCGTQLQPQHKFCPTCGAPAPTPTPPTISQENQKFCVNCGAKIPASAKFCGTCGTKQP